MANFYRMLHIIVVLEFANYQVKSCGEVFSDDALQGTISSKNWPNPYPQGTNCTWSITKFLTSYIKFTVHFLDLHPGVGEDECGDYLLITGTDDSLQLCAGHSGPITWYSPEYTMTLTLVSVVNNGVKSHTGFNATFKVLRVGSSSENLTAPSGSLSSPNYPDHYGGNTDFTWKITAPQGHHVKLTFTAFRLEPSDNCSRYDYVLVRDEKADNPVLAYRCGAPATPMSFSSTGQEMVVKFHTDLLVADKGFLADYVVVANASPKPPITIPDSFSGAYYPVQHSTLNNQHTIKTIRTDSILSCLLMCQRLPGCKSVTITMQDAAFCACKLHNTSSKEVPGSLTEAVGSCLYELVEGFP